jgi:hypothetical protein
MQQGNLIVRGVVEKRRDKAYAEKVVGVVTDSDKEMFVHIFYDGWFFQMLKTWSPGPGQREMAQPEISIVAFIGKRLRHLIKLSALHFMKQFTFWRTKSHQTGKLAITNFVLNRLL